MIVLKYFPKKLETVDISHFCVCVTTTFYKIVYTSLNKVDGNMW